MGAGTARQRIDAWMKKKKLNMNPNLIIMCFDFERVDGATSEFSFAWYKLAELMSVISESSLVHRTQERDLSSSNSIKPWITLKSSGIKFSLSERSSKQIFHSVTDTSTDY